MKGRAFVLFLLFCCSASAQVEMDRRSISPFVAAVDLNIPRSARKELAKANEFIAKREWAKAIEKLKHTTTIYPDFAVAYNNLGVAYAHLGDQIGEREALEKAIDTNDHMVLAYLNLARLNISVEDFPHAESLLQKASSLDPADAMPLILLAYAEFMDQHADEALATCRKAHAIAQGHAFVHRVSARIFEQRNQLSYAVAELHLFLDEENSGPRAETARKELAMLQFTAESCPSPFSLRDRQVLP